MEFKTPESTRSSELTDPPVTPLSRKEKLLAILQDPDSRALLGASYRSIINACVTGGDIPAVHLLGVGEVTSWIMDGLKVTRHWIAKTGFDPSFLDLTPDIKVRHALLSEFGELAMCFHTPTHGWEAGLQFWYYDRHKINHGWRETKRIWSLTTYDELLALQQSKKPIIEREKADPNHFPPKVHDFRELLPYIPKPLI